MIDQSMWVQNHLSMYDVPFEQKQEKWGASLKGIKAVKYDHRTLTFLRSIKMDSLSEH